ncbi:MAG: transcription elongation factor GreA [Patescibacteria group bacterium]|nr:transcription elongation factor GreA [Patescibacteria group bacterium]
MEGNKVFTQEGLDNLKRELDELKNVRRKEVADRIKSAKEFGDLSENAEYQEAKEQQAYVEGRVIELDNLIKNAVVAVSGGDKHYVNIGSHVEVEKDGQKMNFTIVGSTEADPVNKKISHESPLGQALINHKVGDEVEVKLPNGVAVYKILVIK